MHMAYAPCRNLAGPLSISGGSHHPYLLSGLISPGFAQRIRGKMKGEVEFLLCLP